VVLALAAVLASVFATALGARGEGRHGDYDGTRIIPVGGGAPPIS
jgi:hypothetical protein